MVRRSPRKGRGLPTAHPSFVTVLAVPRGLQGDTVLPCGPPSYEPRGPPLKTHDLRPAPSFGNALDWIPDVLEAAGLPGPSLLRPRGRHHHPDTASGHRRAGSQGRTAPQRGTAVAAGRAPLATSVRSTPKGPRASLLSSRAPAESWSEGPALAMPHGVKCSSLDVPVAPPPTLWGSAQPPPPEGPT